MELAEPDRSAIVDVNRTTMRVWEWGDPAHPTVLCIHGAFDHGRMWDEIAPQVAQLGFCVKAIDVRGHGDSGRLSHGHSFVGSILDLGSLMHREAGPVGFVGHSMGAGIALQTGAVWPERTAWVVSLDSLGPPLDMLADFDMATAVPVMYERLVKTLNRSSRVFPDAEAMKAQRGAINTRLSDAWLTHMVIHGSLPVDGGRIWKWDPLFNTTLPDDFDVDWVTEDFKVMDSPALVLMGGEDDTWSDLADDEIAERMSHLRHGQLVTVPGAGHYVHLEQPDFVIAEIRRFLTEIQAS